MPSRPRAAVPPRRSRWNVRSPHLGPSQARRPNPCPGGVITGGLDPAIVEHDHLGPPPLEVTTRHPRPRRSPREGNPQAPPLLEKGGRKGRKGGRFGHDTSGGNAGQAQNDRMSNLRGGETFRPKMPWVVHRLYGPLPTLNATVCRAEHVGGTPGSRQDRREMTFRKDVQRPWGRDRGNPDGGKSPRRRPMGHARRTRIIGAPTPGGTGFQAGVRNWRRDIRALDTFLLVIHDGDRSLR